MNQSMEEFRLEARRRAEGFDFDQYLRDSGHEDEVNIAVEKRYIAWQLEEERRARKLSKKALAEQLGTSRAQIDRVLDKHSQNVTLETLRRVAAALGKRVKIDLV